MIISVFAEHCCRAGQPVPAGYDDESPDVWNIEGEPDELREIGRVYSDLQDVYRARVGRNILKSLNLVEVFHVRDASGEYLTGWNEDGGTLRSPSSEDAYGFPSRQEAELYCDRETDRIFREII